MRLAFNQQPRSEKWNDHGRIESPVKEELIELGITNLNENESRVSV